MAEAQYQPEPDIFIEPEDIPPATAGPVASKFDQNVAVGIDLPFVPDNQGQFKRNYSQLSQARANLRNLLLTRKGERLNHPTLGSNLWNILFEPNNAEILKEDIEAAIMEAVDSWLPYILIREIIISESPDDIDRNVLKILIRFSLRDDLENITETNITFNEAFGLISGTDGENVTET
jgi:phage baseplate assembly protein W